MVRGCCGRLYVDVGVVVEECYRVWVGIMWVVVCCVVL